MWWLTIGNVHLVFQALRPARKFEDFSKVFEQIQVEIQQRTWKKALPPASTITKALPAIRMIAERAVQMGIANIPEIPGSAPKTPQPPDNDMSGRYSGSNNRRLVESKSTVAKRPQNKAERDQEKSRVRNGLVEYLGREANWAALEGNTFTHFCTARGISLSRSEFATIFVEVNAQLRQQRRTKSVAPAIETIPEKATPILQLSRGGASTSPAAIPTASAAAPPPVPQTPMPAGKISWQAAKGKKGRMFPADKQQLEQLLRELLSADPTIKASKAYSRLKPPISEKSFENYFEETKSRLVATESTEVISQSLEANKVVPAAQLETPPSEELATSQERQEPESPKSTPTLASEPEVAEEKATVSQPETRVEISLEPQPPVASPTKSIELHQQGLSFKALPNGDGTWSIEQSCQSIDGETMYKLLRIITKVLLKE